MVGGDSLYEMQLNYGQKSTLSSCCIKMKLVTGRWLFVMPNCSCKCHLSLLSLCRFRSALYVSRPQPVEQDRLKGLNQYSSPTTRCPPLHPCAAALVTALWKVPGRENQQGFQSSRVETKVKKKKARDEEKHCCNFCGKHRTRRDYSLASRSSLSADVSLAVWTLLAFLWRRVLSWLRVKRYIIIIIIYMSSWLYSRTRTPSATLVYSELHRKNAGMPFQILPSDEIKYCFIDTVG